MYSITLLNEITLPWMLWYTWSMRNTNTGIWLTKLKIENYKKLDVEIDGTPNGNGIESDLDRGYFFKKNNNIISRFFSIAGANASGKSSILEAIVFSQRYITNSITPIIMPVLANDPDIIKYLESIDEDMNHSFENNVFQNMNKINMLLRESNDQFIRGKFELFAREYAKEWHHMKSRDNELPITISYDLYFEKYDKIFSIIFIVSNEGTNVKIKTFGAGLEKDVLVPDIKNFFTNIYFNNVVDDSDTLTFKGIKVHVGSTLSDIIQSNDDFRFLDSLLDKHQIIVFLKIFDSSITNYSILDSKKINIEISGKRDSIQLSDLSVGTRVMVSILTQIVKLSKTGGLLIIDEIENHINSKLVSMIKNTVQSYGNIQLIFTTHSSVAAVKAISTKQVFFLRKEFDVDSHTTFTKIIKASSYYNKNNNLQSILDKGMGIDYPDESKIVNFISNLIDGDD